MTIQKLEYHFQKESWRFWQSAGLAILLEFLFFLALGIGHISLFRNPFDNANYLEAQIVQLPAQSHLTGSPTIPDEDEVVFNRKKLHRKRVEKKEPPPKAPEQNQVDSGPSLGPTHGPVALYSPAPVIPNYLRDQNLKTNVVIEFLISSRGLVIPRLLESSGNDELDAIALNTVAKWKFTPASENNVPIDSKTRLKILFEVY